VRGSFIGNYLAIAQLPPEWNFWLGHQGYEYVDLGRLWQIGKFAGIAFWLVLMRAASSRRCWPQRPGQEPAGAADLLGGVPSACSTAPACSMASAPTCR
jgi:nitric oxide reductase large subunit